MRNALAPLAFVLAAAVSAGPTLAADTVPHHEHVALYENCVTNISAQMKPEQAIIAKSLCMCQATMFVKNHTYKQLSDMAINPANLEATARAYMDICVPEVKTQLNLEAPGK